MSGYDPNASGINTDLAAMLLKAGVIPQTGNQAGGGALAALLHTQPQQPQGPAGAAIPIPGGLSPGAMETMRALERQALIPDPEAPAATKVDWPSRIALAFANGLSAYSSAGSGHPPAVDYLAQLKDEQNRKQDKDYRDLLARTDKKRQDARFALSRYDKEQAAADRAQEKKDQLEYNTSQKALRDKEQRDASANRTVVANIEAASRERVATINANARTKSDQLQDGLHKLKATDQADKGQHESYAEIRKWAVAQRQVVAQKLQSGELTTAQVQQMLSDVVESSDLTGKYKEAAAAIIDEKIGTVLRQHDFAQGYQGQGPVQEPAPLVMPDMRRQVGGGI